VENILCERNPEFTQLVLQATACAHNTN